MPPSQKPNQPSPAEDEFLEEYINAEVAQDLEERQEIDQVGRQALRRRLRERGSGSSELAGGDIDVAGDMADDDEETVGGATPTPDQAVVDEIGEGAGLTYQDDEPLNYAKVLERDQHRWELNPASADESEGHAPDDEDNDELNELAALDGEVEVEEEGTELLDVDDLAEDLDDEAEADDLEDDFDEDDDDGEQ